MANYSVSGQLINRNNLIYNKLLMSEKASKEKEDFEDKRKSESATQTRFPLALSRCLNFKRNRLSLKRIFKSLI